MSKITNDGLTRSGTGCLIAVSIHGNRVIKGLNVVELGRQTKRFTYLFLQVGEFCVDVELTTRRAATWMNERRRVSWELNRISTHDRSV